VVSRGRSCRGARFHAQCLNLSTRVSLYSKGLPGEGFQTPGSVCCSEPGSTQLAMTLSACNAEPPHSMVKADGSDDGNVERSLPIEALLRGTANMGTVVPVAFEGCW